LSKSIGVAGGELVSTLVVSRIVISAANDRPQAHTKRCPLFILGANADWIGVDTERRFIQT